LLAATRKKSDLFGRRATDGTRRCLAFGAVSTADPVMVLNIPMVVPAQLENRA